MNSALAAMMAVVGSSLPEMIILRRVLKQQLIAVFVREISLAIAGYLFNWLI